MVNVGQQLSARRSRWQRYELKYLISEAQAHLVRRYCENYLPPDPHANGRRHPQYPILSVYFDSPEHALFYQALHRLSFRFKLRVRSYRMFYDTAAGSTAFVEIKRKVQGVVQKTRARVDSGTASGLVKYGAADLTACGTQPSDAAAEFLTVCRQLAARPAVGVFYEREAYEGNTEERVRVTFDRRMHSGSIGIVGGRYHEVWRPVPVAGVVLEVKFTDTYPFWLSNMLHRLELQRCGVCKYVTCTQAAQRSGRWVEAGELSWIS